MRSERRRGRGCGCGGGCASVLIVLTVGLVLALLHIAFAIGLSFRIPFTESNFTIAGSVGQKEKAVAVLPAYDAGRLGGNQNFINHTSTLTIGPAEGTVLLVLGKQSGAPVLDLHVEGR